MVYVKWNFTYAQEIDPLKEIRHAHQEIVSVELV
jgi:hypothetical protein